MKPDLEDRLRTALRERAAAVTPRLTEPRSDARPAARHWAAPLLAAAAVVVLAIAVAVAVRVHSGSGSNAPAPAAGGAAYAGYQWRVTSLQDRHGVLDVPPDIDATVAFTSNGWVYGDDTVNTYTSRYTVTRGGYELHQVTWRGVTDSGLSRERTRVRVISAVNSLFFSDSGGVPGGTSRRTIVTTVQGDTLTLRTAGIEIITVTLERETPMLATPAAEPSETTQAPTPVSPSPTDLPYSGAASP